MNSLLEDTIENLETYLHLARYMIPLNHITYLEEQIINLKRIAHYERFVYPELEQG